MIDVLERVRLQIRHQGWDALWVTKAANRRYLTGFSGSAGWVLVPARGRAWLLTDGRYTEQARQQTRDIRIVVSQKDPRVQLARVLQRRNWTRLGFEDDDVSVAGWRQVKKAFPALKGLRATGLVEKLRTVKFPEEIRRLRQAIDCTEKAFRVFWPKIKPGVSERVLCYELEKAMLVSGAEGVAFSTIMASGPNSALPHASPTDRRLRRGDLLTIDFGCCCSGYHADLTRTVAIGKAVTRQREVYKIVKKAQESAQKEIVSGQNTSVCDKKARQIFRKAGWEKYFAHSLGHGIGLEIHEAPRLSRLSNERFQAGMVVTCEPGLYFPGWGGVRIEDDLLLTENGSEWLSRSPDELQVAGK